MNLKIKGLLKEPIYVLLLVLLIIFLPPIFSGKTLFYRDLSIQDYPFIKYTVDTIWSGKIPLWNPRVLSGVPQFASIQPPILYPGFILYLIFPFHIALSLLLLIHYFLAGVGVYLIGKYFNLSKKASLLGAVIYSMNGYIFEMSNVQYLVYASTWIPYCFLFFNSFIESKDTKYFHCLVLSFGLLISTGRLDYLYFTVILLLLWYMYLFLFEKSKDYKIDSKSFILLLLSLFLPLLLLSVQIIPSIDYVRESFRGDSLSFNGATFWSLNPLHLLNLIFNNFFGNIFTYKGLFPILEKNFFIYNLYLGFNVFIFTLFGINKNNKKTLILFCIGIIFLILSFGKFTPIYKLLYNYLPGISFLRYPIKLLIFSIFTFSILAMFGFDKFLKISSKIFYISYLSYISIIIFLLIAINISSEDLIKYINKLISYSGIYIDSLSFISSSILFSLLTSFIVVFSYYLFYLDKLDSDKLRTVILLVVIYELFNYNLSNLWLVDKSSLYDKSTIAEDIENLLKEDIEKFYILSDTEANFLFNSNHINKIVDDFKFRVNSLDFNYSINSSLNNSFGYSPSPPTNLFKLITWINDEISSINISSEQKAKILKLMGVKYYIWHINNLYTRPPDYNYMNLVKSYPQEQIQLWELIDNEPIISFKSKILYLEKENDIAKTLVGLENKNIDLDETIITSEQIFNLNYIEQINKPSVLITDFEEYSNGIKFKVKSDSDGFIKISKNYSSNFSLYIDGIKSTLFKANFYQIGLKINKGTSNVVIEYMPTSLEKSIFISITSFTIYFFILIKNFLKKMFRIFFIGNIYISKK